MRLTFREFQSLITIQWSEHVSETGRVYYSPIDDTANKLFNTDFLLKIFVYKFKNQNAITEIAHYDITYPVRLYPDLTIDLPPSLEAISYFADKTNNGFDTFTVKFNAYYVLFIILILYCVILGFYYYCRLKYDKRNIS